MEKKKIAVHVQPNYNNSFSKLWIEFINATPDFIAVPTDMKSEYTLGKILDCKGVMWHFRHTPQDKMVAQRLLTVIEKGLDIPVWPDFNTRWHFDEKNAEYLFLKAINAPVVPSWCFWQYDEAKAFLKSTKEYPFVYKLSVGAGAANVVKVNNCQEALVYLNLMFKKGVFPYTSNEYKHFSMEGNKNYVGFWQRLFEAGAYLLKKKTTSLPWYYAIQKDYFYVQKFIANNEYDIRITIIGNKAFGFVRYNRVDDFRASGSGIIDYSIDLIPLKAIEIAFNISQKAGFQCMAYDFLVDDMGNPLINEMCYCFNSRAVYNCPGFWDSNMKYHKGHLWPQEVQVHNFLQMIRMREHQVLSR